MPELKLDELTTQIEECHKKCSEYESQLAEAEAEGKTAEIEDLKALHEEELKVFAGLEKKLEVAERQANRLKLKRRAEEQALGQKAQDNASTPPHQPPATASDEDLRLQMQSKCFYEYVQSEKEMKDFSTEQLKLLEPESDKVRSMMPKDGGVVLPKSLLAGIMGPQWAYMAGVKGKVKIPMLSSDTTESNASALIPEEFRRELNMLPLPRPTLMPLVSVMPMTHGELTIPQLGQTKAKRFGAVDFAFTGEGEDKNETNTEFEQCKIKGHEATGYTEVSNTLLRRSAIAIEPLLTVLFRQGIQFFFDKFIIQGTGTGEPAGIVKTAGITKVTRETADQVTEDDLVNLKYGVLPEHRANGWFIMGDDVMQHIEKRKDSEGRPLFRDSLAGPMFRTLLGFRTASSTQFPALGVEGDIVFGDPSSYIVAMEEDVVISRSIHFQFKKNVTAFHVFMVAGGRLCFGHSMDILTGDAS